MRQRSTSKTARQDFTRSERLYERSSIAVLGPIHINSVIDEPNGE